MANMGIHRLALVEEPSDTNTEEVRMMALHAYPIYEKAKRFRGLEDAVAGSVIAAGITRRTGKNRKSVSLLPQELAAKGMNTCRGDICLVFGNEQNGLNAEELNICTMACHIPSHPDNPSLNLSHAVQLICYELFTASGGLAGDSAPISLSVIEKLADTVESTLQAAGYFDKPDRFGTRLFFRDIFSRAALTEREASHLEKVFQKLKTLNEKNGKICD